MRWDILGVGELLVDMTPMAGPGGPCFMANPGGAPCNALAMAAKMGSRAAFIGKVGADAFGRALRAAISEAGVDTAGLVMDPEAPTTLAFVHLDPAGDRSFSFYRRGCADVMLRPDEVDPSMVSSARSLYFGSLSLTDEPIRSTVLGLASSARRAGLLVAYDPNYRPALWPSTQVAVEAMRQGLSLCDLLKVSEEEALLISGEGSVDDAAAFLSGAGPALVCVTRGERGSLTRFGGMVVEMASPRVAAVDTTGAGDAFFGTLLHLVLARSHAPGRRVLDGLLPAELSSMLKLSHAAASISVQAYGAIPSLPSRDAVLAAAGA